MIIDYYAVRKQRIEVPEMYTLSPHGRYWYQHGVNRNAVIALVLAAVIADSSAMLPARSGLANFSWFIGMFFGAFFYFLLASRRPSAGGDRPPLTMTQSECLFPQVWSLFNHRVEIDGRLRGFRGSNKQTFRITNQ